MRTVTKVALVLLGLAAIPFIGHAVVRRWAELEPPPLRPDVPLSRETKQRVLGGIRVVVLEGSPEELGTGHAYLLADRMRANEGHLWREFEHWVPTRVVREGILDYARVRYRKLDRGVPEERRLELAAEARGLNPDPFRGTLATYHRMLFLHALYDIALSFEESPLLGCTTFGLAGTMSRDGHVLVGRTFDFEAGEIFDRDKVLFLVKGRGRLAFASVAWPGLVGVVSGMNEAGVVAVVHGARAGEPRATGTPVVFSMRDVLERAKSTDEAVKLLSEQEVMVSHMVFVADRGGTFAVVERAPGLPPHVRRNAGSDRVALTNHLEGPLADDPHNKRIRAETSTLDRRARLDAILEGLPHGSVDARSAVNILRDHECTHDATCPLGDRRSIDALIATHGIVADATAGALWVSAGPHLSAPFVKFDLTQAFAPGFDLDAWAEPETTAADPILKDGRYELGVKQAKGGEGAKRP